MPPIRRDPCAVSPVVAEILLVAITVVLAAVIYLMASGLLSGTTNPPPLVALSGPGTYAGGTRNATLTVAGASQPAGMGSYRFNLVVAGLYGNATAFAASGVAATTNVAGTMYRVTWDDLDGGGKLTQGDQIKVTGNGVSLPASTTFDFILLWETGATVTHSAWTSP